MYRTFWTRGYSRLGCYAAWALISMLLAAGASIAQDERTHEGTIAVLGPPGEGSAYSMAMSVVVGALKALHVPVSTQGVPESTPTHPGIVFLLPQSLDSDRMAALRRFRDTGGRLVAFGVQDQSVCEWLGVSFAPEPGVAPGSMTVVVDEERLPGAGEGLDQYPDRIASVDGREGVAVAWYGAKGQSVAGWLGDDWAAFGWAPTPGDSPGLQRLLGALLALMDPEAALISFQDMLDQFAVMGGFSGLGVVQAYVDRQGTEVEKRLLDAALSLRQEALAAKEQGSPAGMMAASIQAEALLRQALYGLAPPSTGDIRAVFAAPPPPGQAEEFVARIAAGGINAIFLYTGDAANAAYQSGILHSPPDEDPLAEVIAAAARLDQRLDVFAWHGAFQVFDAPAEERSALEAEGRLMVAGDGAVLPWLCPSAPPNLAHEEAILTELVTRYPVRGVLLDFVRMPSQAYCYCQACQNGFGSEQTVGVTEWPPISAGATAAFARYRQKVITTSLARLATAVRTANPSAAVGATLFPTNRNAVAQDVDAWVGSGALDLVVPLHYSGATVELRSSLAQLLLRIEGKLLVVPARRPMPDGAAPSDPLDFIRELEELRQSRVDGVALYAYDPARGSELLVALAQGAFSVRSDPPYSVRLSATLPVRPFPQAEVQGYPPGEALPVSVATDGPWNGDLRIVAASMDGPQQAGVGDISITGGHGTTQVTLAPGVWRLLFEGRLDDGDRTMSVYRYGPAFRVMTQGEFEQARSAQERAETLDIAVLAPGHGTAPLVDEMRVMFARNARIEYVGSLTLDSLRPWDILVVSDPTDLGSLTPASMEVLRGWTESGGRVLMLHNAVGHSGVPRVFLELADTVADDRVQTKRIRIRDPNHPVTQYLSLPPTIELSSEDHVLVRPNRLDTAFLEPADGADPEKALAVASEYGRGRVILCGLRLGQTTSGEDARLNRDESILLEGMLRWLAEGAVVSDVPGNGVTEPNANANHSDRGPVGAAG